MTNKNKIRNALIKLLLQKGDTTRPELVDYLQIRPGTLFEAINTLKTQGILSEPDRKGKKTGRKASRICLNKDHGYYVGLDVEREHTIAVLIDTQGAVCAHEAIASAPEKDAARSMEEIHTALSRIKREAPEAWRKLLGIGFADPGLVDVDRGMALGAVNIPEWKDLDLRTTFHKEYGVDSVIYPASSARAYREYILAGLPADQSLFHVELGIGIGGGFIKNGQPFIGDTYCAMEVGHVVVDSNGAMCQCGNRGCLETLAGENGIKQKVAEIIRSGVQTALAEQDFSVPFFVQCVERNDKAACAAAVEVCEHIGFAMASVVSLLNPGTILFSGPLAQLGEFLTSSVRRILSLRCFPVALDGIQIAVSKLGREDTALGGALLMRQRGLLA